MLTDKNNPQITYEASSVIWSSYSNVLKQIAEERGFKRICDVGGGANPALDREFIQNNDIDYTLLDISQGELDKAPDEYRKVQMDIAQRESLSDDVQYDFIFTKMLAEHVKSGENLHRNVFKLLKPGGVALHFFPTLYAIPFLANYVLPETLASKVLDVVSPRNRHQHDKFPAYYSWCYGPTQKQISRFEGLGYEVLEYRGYYGHENYYKHIPVARTIHRLLVQRLMKRPCSLLTSYAVVILSKPVTSLRCD